MTTRLFCQQHASHVDSIADIFIRVLALREIPGKALNLGCMFQGRGGNIPNFKKYVDSKDKYLLVNNVCNECYIYLKTLPLKFQHKDSVIVMSFGGNFPLTCRWIKLCIVKKVFFPLYL